MKVGQIVKLHNHREYYKITRLGDTSDYFGALKGWVRVECMTGLYKGNVKLVSKSAIDSTVKVGRVSVAQEDLDSISNTVNGLRGYSYKAIWSKGKQYRRLNENCKLLCMTCKKEKRKYFFELAEKTKTMPINFASNGNVIVWVKNLLWIEKIK